MEIKHLEKAIEEAALAAHFAQTDVGQLVLDWCAQRVMIGTNALLSDKFINDHEGYLSARAEVNFARSFVAMLNAKQVKGKQAARQTGKDNG